MNNNNNYGDRYASTKLLTDEEKSSYRAFAQKVHSMSGEDLLKLNTGAMDELTTEQMDIVAWEVRLRELSILKRRGIDPNKEFVTQKIHQEMQNKEMEIYRSGMDPNILRLEHQSMAHFNNVAREREMLMGMTDELLEQSKAYLDANPAVVKSSDLHKVFGGGVNMRAKTYVVDNNGEQIVVDNEKIQKHYRKMYMQRMSEVTGINYLEYDMDGDDGIDYWAANDSAGADVQSNNAQQTVDTSDYEDYEDS